LEDGGCGLRRAQTCCKTANNGNGFAQEGGMIFGYTPLTKADKPDAVDTATPHAGAPLGRLTSTAHTL
jgi:hypothetical protein